MIERRISGRRSHIWIITTVVILLGVFGSTIRPAAADDVTPVTAVASPEATAEVPVELPTVEQVPTPSLPTIRGEKTPISVSTEPFPTAVRIPPTITPLPVQPVVIPSVPSPVVQTAPLPSPAELRESAKLRWGKHIPAAVRQWAFLIVPAGRRYGVDPKLIAAVMTVESGGDPNAWNAGSDARGLMQVLHGSFDPAENIDVGTRMLAGFLRDFRDLRLALAAYNAGPGSVLQFGGIPPFRETRDYVVIVTYLYDVYSHHPLSQRRKAQFRATVQDLKRIPSQRKKTRVIEKAAAQAALPSQPDNSSDSRNHCGAINSCTTDDVEQSVFPTMDPFWPMPGPPDPLQHVGPDLSAP